MTQRIIKLIAYTARVHLSFTEHWNDHVLIQERYQYLWRKQKQIKALLGFLLFFFSPRHVRFEATQLIRAKCALVSFQAHQEEEQQ